MTHSGRISLLLVLVLVAYALTRWFNVLALPVFADEAIYIRWAQLIIDEPLRYAFFPLNDGKTPLFIWMLVPFLNSNADPLLMARLVSVAAGVVQGLVLYLAMRQLVGSPRAALIVSVIGCMIPMWFFHQRMALMDAWLTVWISVTFFGLLKIFHSEFGSRVKQIKSIRLAKFSVALFAELVRPNVLIWILVAGIAFGAALLTKIPAILAAPSLLAMILYTKAPWKVYVLRASAVFAVVGIGGVVFLLLKLHPAFSQLFARGGDFLHPLSAVVFEGVWKVTFAQSLRLFSELYQYLGAGFVLAAIMSLFLKHRRLGIGLALSGLLFMLPILALGQVVYLRYVLPSMLFFTLAAGIGLYDLWTVRAKYQLAARCTFLVIAVHIFWVGIGFMIPAYHNPDALPLPHSDRVQYLTEWSSGHGIKEVTETLLAESQNKTIYLATEGFFGTLPDGILLYLHQEEVERLKVEGIGQPIGGFSPELKTASSEYDAVWLVVNSHRLSARIPPEQLLSEYCRPYNAPCLQLWDITSVVRE